jgi:biotin operon repressor
MNNQAQNEIREMRDGAWYWIHKALIREYLPKIKATGLAVYSLLASLADRNQTCYPSQKYLSQISGYSRATINRALKLLEKEGLIAIHKRGRKYCSYQLLRLPRCKEAETQMLTGRNSDVKFFDTNKNILTRNINNNDIAVMNFLNSKASKGESREELLALDLAQALNDRKNLKLYLSLARKYPESFLRQILGEVREIPLGRMRKGRAALFNYLVKKYGQKFSKDLSS